MVNRCAYHEHQLVHLIAIVYPLSLISLELLLIKFLHFTQEDSEHSARIPQYKL